MPLLVRLFNRLRNNDLGWASFWLLFIIFIFFLPVVFGFQSLTEAVPIFYSHPLPEPSIKTLWQVDGGWHAGANLPFIKAKIELIKQGIPPLWDSYSGSGEPFSSNIAGAIYYPLRLIFFFLWNTTVAFDWYFLLRFFIAGLGMFLYLKVLGLRRVVSLWGGIAYAFSGYFVIYLTYSFLDVDALLPWILCSIEYYRRHKHAASAMLIGLLLSFTIVIGHPESAIISGLLAGIYFIWRNINKDELKKLALHSGLIVTTASLFSLPFIIDILVSWTQGKTVDDWQGRGLAHFPLVQLLHFLVTPSMMPEVAASGHLWDRYEIIIPYLSIGVILFFVLGFFIKNKPSWIWPFYTWIAFVILKNAGFPIIQLIGRLPILNQVGWHKAYGPMAGAMVICAAMAFEQILKNGGAIILWNRFYKFLAAIPLVFLAVYIFAKDAFVNAYVPNFDFFNRQPEMIEGVLALIREWPKKIQGFIVQALQNNSWYFTFALFVEIIIFATIALFIISRLRRGVRWAPLAMIFFTALELWFYMPKIRDGFNYIDPYKMAPQYVKFIQSRTGNEDVARIFAFDNVFVGRVGGLYKIQKAQDASDIKPRRYFKFLPNVILRENPLTSTIGADKLPYLPEKFFDAYNVRYLLSERSLPYEPWLSLVYDDDIKIYENKNALPKAYVVFQKETAGSSDDARKLFYDTPFEPHQSVILEDKNAIALPNHNETISYASAAVTNYQSNNVSIDARTDKNGVLVLTDSFYPGWQAYLDGKKVATYPANVMFRGIFLPAGNHIITFKYEPLWFWPSIAVSLITASSMAFLMFRQKKDGVARNVI